MRVHWTLRTGESIEVYDGVDGVAKDKVVVYRVGVERFHQGEVKIVRQSGKPKVLTKDSRSPVIDVAVAGALFIEVSGKDGLASGWYEAVLGPG